MPDDTNEGQAVTRVDYHLTQNQSVFGRYMATFRKRDPSLSKTGNVLATSVYGQDNLVQTATVGDTATFGSRMVNAFNATFNRRSDTQHQPSFFEPRDLGSNVYSYSPHAMFVTVADPGFRIGGSNGANQGVFWSNTYQVTDTVTLVRGRHELGLGANLALWRVYTRSDARAGGVFTFNGQTAGLPLADLLIGRLQNLEHGAYGGVDVQQWYIGNFAQDTWRATDRLTFNLGLRWEPFFGQQARDGAIYNFNPENFQKGVRSTVFLNAPAGFLYPGDSGFPEGTSGLNKRWLNFCPAPALHGMCAATGGAPCDRPTVCSMTFPLEATTSSTRRRHRSASGSGWKILPAASTIPMVTSAAIRTRSAPRRRPSSRPLARSARSIPTSTRRASSSGV